SRIALSVLHGDRTIRPGARNDRVGGEIARYVPLRSHSGLRRPLAWHDEPARPGLPPRARREDSTPPRHPLVTRIRPRPASIRPSPTAPGSTTTSWAVSPTSRSTGRPRP